MYTTFEVTGTYGSGKTPCNVLCCNDTYGTWYVVENGQNVNFTYDPVGDGVNVEELTDTDCFTVSDGVTSLDQLEALIYA